MQTTISRTLNVKRLNHRRASDLLFNSWVDLATCADNKSEIFMPGERECSAILYLSTYILTLPMRRLYNFRQKHKDKIFFLNTLTLSYWYSSYFLWVLSDEYPYARVSVIFQLFCEDTKSIRVNMIMSRISSRNMSESIDDTFYVQ